MFVPFTPRWNNYLCCFSPGFHTPSIFKPNSGFGEDEEDTEDTGDESFPGFEPMDERSLADTAKRFGIHHHDIPEHFIHILFRSRLTLFT